MSAYEIPLSPQPQSFNIDLLGTNYRLSFNWCEPHASWTMDIASTDGTPIITSIPLITGADLLAQYKHLGLPGKLICQDLENLVDPPTFENLGENALLFLVTEP